MSYKIKNKFVNKFNAEEVKVNLEEIAFQYNDEFIKEATSRLADIRGYIRDNKIKASDKIPTFILRPLAECFENRFGPKFVVDTNTFENAFTVTDHPDIKKLNNLMKKSDLERLVKDANSKELERASNRDRLMEDAETGSGDEFLGFKETKKIKAILSSLLQKAKVTVEDGIHLDMKNGKIIGKYAKECFIYINADFVSFYHMMDMDDSEVLAILLHEIGHNFFRLETASRVYADIFLLSNIIVENYEKTPAEVLDIFYKESKIKRTGDKNPKNLATVLVTAAGDILTGNKAGDKDTRLATTNEQYADEFAGRFGMSAELASGLNKLTENGKYGMLNIDVPTELANIFMLGTLCTLFLSRVTLGAVLGAYGFAAGFFMTIWGIIMLASAWFRYGNTPGANTYDTYMRRLQRARNTAVRCLSCVKDKNVKDIYIRKIEDLDRSIKDAKENEGFLEKAADKLGMLFHPSNYSSFRASEIMEVMMANDLIVATNKIESLGR